MSSKIFGPVVLLDAVTANTTGTGVDLTEDNYNNWAFQLLVTGAGLNATVNVQGTIDANPSGTSNWYNIATLTPSGEIEQYIGNLTGIRGVVSNYVAGIITVKARAISS